MGFYVRSAHIKHEEVNNFIENFTLCELFEGLSAFWTQAVSWQRFAALFRFLSVTMDSCPYLILFVPLDLDYP